MAGPASAGPPASAERTSAATDGGCSSPAGAGGRVIARPLSASAGSTAGSASPSLEEPAIGSSAEGEVRRDRDRDDPCGDEVDGGAERGPPAGVRNEAGAVLPQVLAAVTGQPGH